MDKKKLELMNTMIGAMLQLSELWSESNTDEDERLCLNYPFDKSFDELTFEVQKWRDAYYHGEEQE